MITHDLPGEDHRRTMAWLADEQEAIRNEASAEKEANDLVFLATQKCGSASKALRYVEQEVDAGPVKLAALNMLIGDAQMEREAMRRAA